jgi:hypothetical protein
MRRPLILLVALASGPVDAALLRVVATGDQPDYYDPAGLLAVSAPSPDAVMTLAFTVDTGVADASPDPKVGSFAGAITDMTLSVGKHTVQATTQSGLTLLDNAGESPPTDIWYAFTFDFEGPLRTEISLSLLAIGGNAIASDAFSAPAFPAPWSLGFIYYGISDTSDPQVGGVINLANTQVLVDSVTVTTVPAPPALWLLATGILAVAGFRVNARGG